jgi:hypothetical protein
MVPFFWGGRIATAVELIGNFLIKNSAGYLLLRRLISLRKDKVEYRPRFSDKYQTLLTLSALV